MMLRLRPFPFLFVLKVAEVTLLPAGSHFMRDRVKYYCHSSVCPALSSSCPEKISLLLAHFGAWSVPFTAILSQWILKSLYCRCSLGILHLLDPSDLSDTLFEHSMCPVWMLSSRIGRSIWLLGFSSRLFPDSVLLLTPLDSLSSKADGVSVFSFDVFVALSVWDFFPMEGLLTLHINPWPGGPRRLFRLSQHNYVAI